MGAFFANFMAIVTILAPSIQTTGDPGAGYTWSLGELATSDSARFDVTWDNGSWSDPYDSVEELTALSGTEAWTIVEVTEAAAGYDCAAGGANSDADRSAVQSFINSHAYCGGTATGDCRTDGVRGGVIFRFPASCTIDIKAGTAGVSPYQIGLQLGHDNVAYVGGGLDSTYIACNDNNNGAGYTSTTSPNVCVYNGSGDTPSNVGSAHTWTGGTDGSAGSPIALSACSGLAAGDKVRLFGTGQDGETLTFVNRVDTIDGSCNVVLDTPLAIAVTTPGTVQELSPPNTKMVLLKDLRIGFPYVPDGTCAVYSCAGNISGKTVAWFQGDDTIFTNVALGPYPQNALDITGSFHVTIKHSEMGPCQMCKRRGTVGGVVTNNRNGGTYSYFDNIQLLGAKRFATVARYSAIGHWVGFNYTISQDAEGLETGNHCDGITNEQGITYAGVDQLPAGERSIFLNHDGVATGVGAYLIEANDFECQANNEGGSVSLPRYSTLYRNRSNRRNGNYLVYNALEQGYFNFIANRFGDSFMTNAPSRHTNALGRWNVVEGATAIGTPGTGSTWPTSGAGKNYSSETGPHDDYPLALGLPPSLALQTNTAPDWWCTESGPWDGTWNFGAGDGYGGNTYKLPAQIRYEGTTCTPP